MAVRNFMGGDSGTVDSGTGRSSTPTQEGGRWSEYGESDGSSSRGSNRGVEEPVVIDPFARSGKRSRPASSVGADSLKQQADRQAIGDAHYDSLIGRDPPQYGSPTRRAVLTEVSGHNPSTPENDKDVSPSATYTGGVKIGATRQIEDSLLLFV
jgi:hypothetical protein